METTKCRSALFFPTEEAMENGAASGKKPPVILFFHGGGWVTESVENYQRVCARMGAVHRPDRGFGRVQAGHRNIVFRWG